ncbi:MAG: biopolymer transporter ExbD [Chitinophagaceae bacterium]
MATLNESPLPARRKAGVRPVRRHSLKTDMTPMVDLGFLLISFFIFTTQMSKPVVTNLNMPHDGPPITLGMSNALTMLLGDDHSMYYYEGEMKAALSEGKIIRSNFDVSHGIGQVMRDKQQGLERINKEGEGKEGMMVLIKPMKGANYDDVMKVLDEILINEVKKYALIKPEAEEIAFVDQKTQ